MENEIWKVFYDGPRVKYEASSEGRIKCNGRIIDLGIQNGYYACRKQYVHRIIAQLFIPNPENKPYVDHIDTNRLNNKVTNLRWVTPSENMLNPITRQRNSIAMKAIQKEIQNRPEVKAKNSAGVKASWARRKNILS